MNPEYREGNSPKMKVREMRSLLNITKYQNDRRVNLPVSRVEVTSRKTVRKKADNSSDNAEPNPPEMSNNYMKTEVNK